jgi:hypothetical protein
MSRSVARYRSNKKITVRLNTHLTKPFPHGQTLTKLGRLVTEAIYTFYANELADVGPSEFRKQSFVF